MIKKNKFNSYINKTIIGKIITFSKFDKILIRGDTISINYFYWWYKELYNFKTIGLLVRKKRKFKYNVLSLTLFYIIKKIRVNQIYFNTSPFITLLKKRKKTRKKIIKTLFLL